jgi:hypothetical protein
VINEKWRSCGNLKMQWSEVEWSGGKLWWGCECYVGVVKCEWRVGHAEKREQQFTTLSILLSTTNKLLLYKPYSNPSGPMVYNSEALLLPQTLKFWHDSNIMSCVWLWTHHGTSLIHSSEGTSAACPTVKEEIRRYSSHYGDRLRNHPTIISQ